MSNTINVDIHSRCIYNNRRWIPSPVSKPSPQYNYAITLDDILVLLNFSEVWIYDANTKKNISMNNLEEYFPEFIPVYNRGGGSGGGGTGGESYKFAVTDGTLKITRIKNQ